MSPIWRRLQDYTKKTQKIYIVPTKAGLIFIGVNFTLFLMGLIYANNLALLLAFGLFAVLLLIMFQTHSVLEKLELGALTTKSACVDEAPGVLIWPPLPKRAHLGVSDQNKNFFFSSSNSQDGLYALKAPRRQRISAQHIKIFSHGESKLFYVWTYRPKAFSLYVYPAKMAYKTSAQASSEHKPSDNGQFREHKNYQVGEHASRIDWKVFAKSEQLLVKNFEDDTSSAVFVDVEAEEGDKEQKLSRAAYRITEANRRALPWRLKAGAKQLPLSQGPNHLKSSMELLSEY